MLSVKEDIITDNHKGQEILRFQNITKIFSGTIALRRVNITIREGEVHGIIGKNGAGKTTLVGVMSGIVPPTEGEIVINDRKHKTLSRIRAKKEGIAIVTQEPEVIPDWSVAENLLMPDFICSWNNQLVKWKALFARAEQVLQKYQMNIHSHDKMKDLSISEQQVLLVLKACYIDDARIIIMDEVSTSLSKNDQDHLYEIIHEQKSEGKAIIYISHRMDEILQICDRVTVIRDGTVVDTEERSTLNKKKLSTYIVGEKAGRTEGVVGPSSMPEDKIQSEIVMSVENFTKYGDFQNINFQLRRGEVIGLAGMRGSGRTELFKAIVGMDPTDEGWVNTGGGNCRFNDPANALRNGIAYLPENRDMEGLIDVLSVQDNLTLTTLPSLTRRGIIDKKKEQSLAMSLIDLLTVQTPSPAEEVKNLSGGNRQKVMLGKILATSPTVFILDEPTKGIDIATKVDILGLIRNELIKSAGVIMTTPGLEDLMPVCDRILILYKGEIIDEFSREEFSETALYLAMQGTQRESIDT